MTQPDPDLSGARILIVDDTKANLDLLCELLEAQGYSIAMAPNGDTALRIADRFKPDLILLDVMMPGIDGFEVCRRLKANPQTARIPVIFITAQNETESVVTGFEVGGVDYIAKPFHQEEVRVRVRTHLSNDHLARELSQKNDELTHANRQIRESAERKSAFLASMSHEIRTPITIIKGYVDNMLAGIGGELSDRHQQNLTRVTQSTDHLMDLVNDILDLSKIEAGRMDMETEPFEVKDLVADCCVEARRLVQSGVELTWTIADDIGQGRTDRGRARQILTNLLSNAAKFTEAGEITVHAHREDARKGDPTFVISVSDTGIGIPQDHLEAIFDEFRQVKGSDRQHKGTGLGLAITKKLTKLLGGTIEVASELGKGSTFTVTIPATHSETEG